MSAGYNPEWVEVSMYLIHISNTTIDFIQQWEKIMGRPALPEDRIARREAFNAGLIGLQAQLPQTDPGIQTSMKSLVRA